MTMLQRPTTMRWSFTNLVESVFSVTSENAIYPAVNVLRPQEPFKPWKTLTLDPTTLELDLSAPARLIILVAANFTDATLNGEAITIRRNRWNWRYQYGVVLPEEVSDLTLEIPTQATTDGDTVFRLGGIWAGASTPPPLNVLFNLSEDTYLPVEDLTPQHRGWSQRLIMGEPRARFEMARIARVNKLSPGFEDDLHDWSEIERQIWEANIFALTFGTEDSSMAFILQRMGDMSWDRRRLGIYENKTIVEEVLR